MVKDTIRYLVIVLQVTSTLHDTGHNIHHWEPDARPNACTITEVLDLVHRWCRYRCRDLTKTSLDDLDAFF